MTVVATGFENRPRPSVAHHGADASGEGKAISGPAQSAAHASRADGGEEGGAETPPVSDEDLEVPAFLRLLDDEQE